MKRIFVFVLLLVALLAIPTTAHALTVIGGTPQQVGCVMNRLNPPLDGTVYDWRP